MSKISPCYKELLYKKATSLRRDTGQVKENWHPSSMLCVFKVCCTVLAAAVLLHISPFRQNVTFLPTRWQETQGFLPLCLLKGKFTHSQKAVNCCCRVIFGMQLLFMLHFFTPPQLLVSLQVFWQVTENTRGDVRLWSEEYREMWWWSTVDLLTI